MRKAVKKSAEWIHATLILAIIMPLIYCLGAEQPDIIGQCLYLKCLVIILPVIATDFAVSKCKGLLSYLMACTIICVVTSVFGWTIAGRLHQSAVLWIYMTVLMAETVFVIVNRMAERIQRKKDEDDGLIRDPSWRPSFNDLRAPSFATLIFFVLAYGFALNLNNPAVCNASLFSGAMYTVITILYQYVSNTENYLFLNKRTCNIPSKRIYGIGNGMLAIFFLLFIIVLLPSLFTISSRNYHDLRKSGPLMEFEDIYSTVEESPGGYVESPMQYFYNQSDEPRPTPKWLILLSYIVGIIALVIFTAALIKTIYDTFRVFREAADENGDIVEELEETAEAVKIEKTYMRRRKLSERERIRKEYRKYIRRYRKERPAHHESPLEIEINAGIAENEECREMHRRYELARYGQDS